MTKVQLLSDLLDRAAQQWPARVALSYRGRQCTFAELRENSLQVEAQLRRDGVQRGDRVGVVIEDFIDAIGAMFGIARRGAVYVLINGDTTPYAAGHVLADCAPVAVYAAGDTPARDAAVTLGIPVRDYPANLPDPGAPEPVPFGDRPISQDIVSILYTSGSTGRPKGVVGTHANMVFAAEAIARRLRLRADDVIGCVLPLAFDYGVYQILLSMISGARLVWEQGAAAGPGLLKFLVDEQVTVLPSVPGLAHNLDRLSRRGHSDLPPLRVLTNTGAAMSPSLVERIQNRYPKAGIFLMFGLTECKRISILTPEERLERPASVGRPLDDTEIFIIDKDGNRLPPGTVGELVVRGAHVTKGYWNDVERTALRFRPYGPVAETALFTGDQCWIDDEGYLYFDGRDDDVYKANGFRVSATEVGLAAEDIPGVDEAFCVPARGEHPAVLAVVAKLEPAQVREALQERLEWFKVPDHIVGVERLPLNRNGKVDAAALRTLAGAETR